MDAHGLPAELQEERIGVDCDYARSRQPIQYSACQRARPRAKVEYGGRRAGQLAQESDHHLKALLALGQVAALLSLPPS